MCKRARTNSPLASKEWPIRVATPRELVLDASCCARGGQTLNKHTARVHTDTKRRQEACARAAQRQATQRVHESVAETEAIAAKRLRRGHSNGDDGGRAAATAATTTIGGESRRACHRALLPDALVDDLDRHAASRRSLDATKDARLCSGTELLVAHTVVIGASERHKAATRHTQRR